ncbi:type VII secretion target [Cellulomonas soli]|uniref:ESX-1 secretion-associated protein n=1 Tax=Cellulomonas soli TaxID=931535 RepID=A0A512PI72_9CELL|nr:type VII secretion target [Cellulomonas soli]NYI58720.1 hypothetical protein [Cellulomonas soli]GEP70897.1 hypothetical protein CSO01_36120 [Cellulomonas soli]
MSAGLSVEGTEVTALAGQLDTIGGTYGCPALSTAGTGAQSTGHVELADVLPQFCQFTSEVLNALVANLTAQAEELRSAAQLYCTADDDTSATLGSFSLPTFNPRTELP